MPFPMDRVYIYLLTKCLCFFGLSLSILCLPRGSRKRRVVNSNQFVFHLKILNLNILNFT